MLRDLLPLHSTDMDGLPWWKFMPVGYCTVQKREYGREGKQDLPAEVRDIVDKKEHVRKRDK